MKVVFCSFAMEKAKSQKIRYFFVEEKSAVLPFDNTTLTSLSVLLLSKYSLSK